MNILEFIQEDWLPYSLSYLCKLMCIVGNQTLETDHMKSAQWHSG